MGKSYRNDSGKNNKEISKEIKELRKKDKEMRKQKSTTRHVHLDVRNTNDKGQE